MMKGTIDKFFAGIVALTAWQFFPYWLDRRGYQDLYNVANSLEMRPFVYRVLVPMLARMLGRITQLTAMESIVPVLIIFSIVMYYSIKYLYETFTNDECGPVVAFVGCLALFVIMIQESKVYDIPTAAFFALGLALLARGKLIPFYILYPFATLNRETTFLLSAFYILYYFRGPISKRHWFLGSVYPILVYVFVRFITMTYFSDLPGAEFDISWRYVFGVYRVHYFLTFAYLVCITWLLYMTLRRWAEKPSFLRVAFLVIFPIQLVLHFILGCPYEWRVFAESIPIFSVLIMIPTIPVTKGETDKIPFTSGTLVMAYMLNKPQRD